MPALRAEGQRGHGARGHRHRDRRHQPAGSPARRRAARAAGAAAEGVGIAARRAPGPCDRPLGRQPLARAPGRRPALGEGRRPDGRAPAVLPGRVPRALVRLHAAPRADAPVAGGAGGHCRVEVDPRLPEAGAARAARGRGPGPRVRHRGAARPLLEPADHRPGHRRERPRDVEPDRARNLRPARHLDRRLRHRALRHDARDAPHRPGHARPRVRPAARDAAAVLPGAPDRRHRTPSQRPARGAPAVPAAGRPGAHRGGDAHRRGRADVLERRVAGTAVPHGRAGLRAADVRRGPAPATGLRQPRGVVGALQVPPDRRDQGHRHREGGGRGTARARPAAAAVRRARGPPVPRRLHDDARRGGPRPALVRAARADHVDGRAPGARRRPHHRGVRLVHRPRRADHGTGGDPLLDLGRRPVRPRARRRASPTSCSTSPSRASTIGGS